MMHVFVDTSAWLALFNRDDPDHATVDQYVRDFDGRLVTSNFVFDETVTHCMRRGGHAAASRAGKLLRDSDVADLVRVTAEDEEAAWTLLMRRPDKRYSFTDCTSFVIMRRLGLRQVLSLDADFRREGFETAPM